MNLDGSGGGANPKVGSKIYEKERGECSSRNTGKCKRISGVIVEKEELWKLKRCMVGMMSTVCSVRNIMMRLQAWGLGEIKVQRMGGKTYLLSFDNDELFTMLEDVNWSYLKEIFSEVYPCFKDDSVKLVSSQKIHVNAGHISCKTCSDSSSESIRSKSRELETEALIAVCTGKDYSNNEDNVDTLVTNRHLGERDMRGGESKVERSFFSSINLDDMSQKNGEGISRNVNTDSWQKETSKEVGSEPGQLVDDG
ncbi:hypothetical protein V6N13_054391 [Hibiscus sabdariffa]